MHTIISSEQRQTSIIDDAGEPAARNGDVIVGIRYDSPYLPIMRVMGDPWTHVGIAVQPGIGGGLVTAEAGPSGSFSRSFDEFVQRYDVVGVLRPALCPTCIERAAAAAWDHVMRPRLHYSMPLCAANAAGPLLRRALPRRFESIAIRGAFRLSRRALRRDPLATACGPFVAGSFDEACERCRIAETWPVRPRFGLLDRAPTVTDVHRDRTERAPAAATLGLMTPNDLWCGVPARYRAIWWKTPVAGLWQHCLLVEQASQDHRVAA